MKSKKTLLILLIFSVFLGSCSVLNPPQPTPIPTWTPVVADTRPNLGSGGVVASGEVLPVRFVELSFNQNGSVERVELQEDQSVEEGQLLAQLEGLESLESNVTAAELALLSAQQELDTLYETNDMVRVEVFQKIVEANQVIGDTKFRLDYLNMPITFHGLEMKEALEKAKQNYEQARSHFEPYKYRPSGDATRKDLLEELELARSDFNSVMRLMELEADLQEAEVKLAEAEKRFNILENGPNPDDVALAQARIKNAQAQLSVAQKELEGAKLIAPFSGTLVSLDIYPGQTVLAGEQIVTLADLSELRVETTDLSERDISKVQVGDDAVVYIEALSLDIPGKVIRISPQANIIGGDVVYTVVVELSEQPAGLRWGMSVEVEISQLE
jgi:HlyD family secretion protein